MIKEWIDRALASRYAGYVFGFCSVLLVAVLVLLALWVQRGHRQGENKHFPDGDFPVPENSSRSREGDPQSLECDIGVTEKAYRANIQIFNALAEESSHHKTIIELYKPGKHQIDRIESGNKTTDTPRRKRIQEMTPTRYHVEEFVGDKLVATYLGDAEGNRWKTYQGDGKLVAEKRRAPLIYDRLLFDIRQLSEMPDSFSRETRDGKNLLKYASREFGSCSILTLEVQAEDYDLRKIQEVEVFVAHDSEELYKMSVRIETDPGEVEDPLFELPESATINIDEKKEFLKDIRRRASRFYSEQNDEELQAITSELESKEKRFDGDFEYYETWWQFALASKQFDKAFEYLDKINRIKPDEALYRTIATLVAQNPDNPETDDDLIAQVREECAQVDKYDLGKLDSCAYMLKSVGLAEEATEFYKAAGYAKPYDFVLVHDSYQYLPGSTEQLLSQGGQEE